MRWRPGGWVGRDAPGEPHVRILQGVMTLVVVEMLFDAEDHGQPEEHVVAQPVVDHLVDTLGREVEGNLVESEVDV